MDNKVSSPEEHISEDGHVGSPFTESPTNCGSVNSTKSTPVLSSKNRSFSSPDACADVWAEHHAAFKGLDMEEADCVILNADYVVFKGTYYPDSVMTFSDRFIKIESSVIDKDVETFMYEWGIDDVVSFESQNYTTGSVVKVRIHVLAKSMVETENMHNASAIEDLEVVLFDPEWFFNLDKIRSLNVRYKATWRTLAPSEVVDGGDDLPINKNQLTLRPYFPDFDEQFDEVIYPKGDVDAVSITKADVDRLNPETFLNDTIIDFYVKYLKNKFPAGERNRFHFFNSFFFRKLADLDKNPDSALDGKAAFQRVRKWTRKVNLFEKDYIFIPVNYNLHWSLIIICHPGEVADFTDERMHESSRVPCILHMDSIQGTHAGLKNLIQTYLLEEWKERKKVSSEDVSSKFLNLRFLPLELPQQENYYDCGLFLLHYLELFVKDAPINFNPFNITKDSVFLTADWFIPGDVSLKRPYIQRLVHEILTNRSQGNGKNSTIAEGVADLPKLEVDSGMELIAVNCNRQNTCVQDSLYSGQHHGIDMNLRGGSPVRSSECPSEPSLGFRDLFESGTSSGLLFEPKLEENNGMGLISLSCTLGSFRQPRGAMSPIQEEVDEDDAADHCNSMQNGSSLRELDGLASEGCNDFFRIVSWDRSFDPGDHGKEDDESSLDSHYDSDDEVKVIEDSPERRDPALPPKNEKRDLPKFLVVENLDSLTDSFAEDEVKVIGDSPESRGPTLSPKNGKRDPPKYLVVENLDSLSDSFASASSEMMVTPAEDSQHYFDGFHTNSEQDAPLPNVEENEHQQSSQEPEEEGAEEENGGLSVKTSSSDSDELRPVKRPRLSPLDWETGPEIDPLKDK